MANRYLTLLAVLLSLLALVFHFANIMPGNDFLLVIVAVLAVSIGLLTGY